MSTRNLDALFSPRSIALVGASREAESVGNILARNLLAGGFKGEIAFVNPHETEIEGVRCASSVDALTSPPDLAVLATPPGILPSLIQDLGALGCRAAIVITAGLTPDVRDRILQAAKPHLLRILGPNCLGFMSPRAGVNATFAQAGATPGGLALLSQSGAIATSMLDWANGNGVGFSHLISLGDMADIDFGDMLDFLALDAATSAILIYAENVTNARKFMSAARMAARSKPVIMLKAGRSAAGAKAATSHTGALAGSDRVYDAALRRAGVLRVGSLETLFEAAETLASGVTITSERLVIVTNGGGLGVMAADAMADAGLSLSKLTPQAQTALDKVLPPAWSHGNPIDILGDAPGERYEAAIAVATAEFAGEAILAANCPTGVADSRASAEAVIRAKSQRKDLPLLACWMGEATAAAGRHRLEQAGIPSFNSPEAAIRAFSHLVERKRALARLLQTPTPTPHADPQRIVRSRALLQSVIDDGRSVLTEVEAKQLLGLYGIPVVETRVAATAGDVLKVARDIPPPLVLKILSRDITHKSDVGGVRLGLKSASEAQDAAEEMLSVVRANAPKARIDGFTVQGQIERPFAQEVLAGIVDDPTFGPCVAVGQGGVATDVVDDRVLGLPPLNDVLAADMIERTRIFKLLRGYRNRPPADLPALERVLVALSSIASDLPEVMELDINPLLADADGVIALDARVVARSGALRTDDRLCIRPYPAELSETVCVGHDTYRIRPIEPSDADQLVDLTKAASGEEFRFRFHGAAYVLDTLTSARLTQIDYDREMVFLAQQDTAIVGVVRLAFDPEFAAADVGILVREDRQDSGLGRLLLKKMLTYGFSRGALVIWSEFLQRNARARTLAADLGGVIAAKDSEILRVEFRAPASS